MAASRLVCAVQLCKKLGQTCACAVQNLADRLAEGHTGQGPWLGGEGQGCQQGETQTGLTRNAEHFAMQNLDFHHRFLQNLYSGSCSIDSVKSFVGRGSDIYLP